jgi:hypothetical protein
MSQQIQENWTNSLHPILLQCIKTRTQQKKQQQNIYKQLEVEQHIAQ